MISSDKKLELQNWGNRLCRASSYFLKCIDLFFAEGSIENAAFAFYEFYEERRWLNAKGGIIRDWKLKDWEWLWKI